MDEIVELLTRVIALVAELRLAPPLPPPLPHGHPPAPPPAPAPRRRYRRRQREPPPLAPPPPHPRSLFHGVNWFPRTRMWRVAMTPSKKGRQLHIGTFVSEEEAGRAYDVVAKERNYPAHKLNFPNE